MAFLSFLIVVALVVCHNPKQLPEEKSEELPVFNLEAVAEETVPSAFMWNDITEKATFIPLSSDEKTLLSGSLGITFMDNEYIVIVDYKTGSFYRYGVDGKVQRSFKYEGNGPGEYVYISYLYVDPGYAFMDIYDSGNRKRIRYDWEGNLLEERELVDIVAPVFATEHYMVCKYSINSLVYWVTYVHNVVYSFYRSMIYCYINSTQRCAGSIEIDIIPTNGADKRKFFPFAPYFPVTNVIKRYFYPYFPAIIGIKGYSFPYFPYLSGIMKIKTALYSLFSRLDWHKTVVFPCLGEIYEGIRSLSWEIPVT